MCERALPMAERVAEKETRIQSAMRASGHWCWAAGGAFNVLINLPLERCVVRQGHEGECDKPENAHRQARRRGGRRREIDLAVVFNRWRRRPGSRSTRGPGLFVPLPAEMREVALPSLASRECVDRQLNSKRPMRSDTAPRSSHNERGTRT
jgi:hypothetical protein